MAVHRFTAFAVIFLLSFAKVLANEATLEILPNGDVQTKPIGSSNIFTCKPIVENVKLVTDMQWLDPQGRPIESLNNIQGQTKPAMYTEYHHDSSSLLLFFNSLQEEQAGKYTCKGTYANTYSLNKTVMIETIVQITFDDAPTNQYPILGDDFSVNCKVRARPSPSVDWLYNGELIRTNEHYVIETHALKIKNVQESDDGIYQCRATVVATGELKERPIRVEVHTRPEIEGLVSPKDIIEGETVSIPCRAKGKPPPKYSWVKSITQQNLSDADRFGVDADTGILTITNVNREDAGEYRCIASNAAGVARTDIQIDVIVKPKIMEFINKTVVQGKDVNLECKAYGRPVPKIIFKKHTADAAYKEGDQLKDDRIIVTNDPDPNTSVTTGILTIRNSTRWNDGLYECMAQNSGGVSFKNGHLAVEFPPSFSAMPNRTIWSWERRPVNLTCIAESIPNATITWTVGGNDRIETDPNVRKYGDGPTSTLNVIPLDMRYYTNYKCIARNTHGTTEHIIELQEAQRPGGIIQAKVAEFTATTIKFDLVPPPTHPDLPLRTISCQYKRDGQIWTAARNKTWSLNSVYVIENLEPQTVYDFRFAVSNDVGLGNWGEYIHETTPGKTFPNEPKMIVKSGQDYEISPFNNQYELAWITPANNGEPIDLYQIRYCQLKRVSGDFKTLENTCLTEESRTHERSRYFLKHLYSDTFYVAEVRAHNIMGYSKPGVIRFKTARGLDTTVVHHQAPLISSAAIIGIVIAILLIIIVIIDVVCCCANKTGIIFYVCERSRRKPMDEEDAKLGSLYGWQFPLPYCDQKMANVAGVTAIQDSGSGKNTIRLVKHTAIDEKEPLKEEKKITPIIDSGLRRETSVTFNGKRSISKTGFVGKDSAV
ncbi:fasciclin-2 isoform X2 [Prorops nasuta]|uniref:fasciclin-2 isoform X2 n=1 Tax=Prorops nasuta TaxID=863751 RepID=UPI0034CF5C74